jgi:hypothetical protein
MARSDSGRGVALRSVVQPAHSGGSPELAVYGAPDLSFHLRHWGDVENLLCSYWEDGGQQWRLVSAGRLGASSVSMVQRALGLLWLNRGHRRGWQTLVFHLGWSIRHGWWHIGAAASFTRRQGFRQLQIKICRRTGTIHRTFCTEL